MLLLFLFRPALDGRSQESVVKRLVHYSAEMFCIRGNQRGVFMSVALSSTDNTVSINWKQF